MSANGRYSSRSDMLRGTSAPDSAALHHRLTTRFEAGPMQRRHLGALVETASESVPLAAGAEPVERVYDHDPRSFWGLRRCRDDADNPPPGVTAFLLLSRTGLDHLLCGTLDFANPQAEALSAPDSEPVAMYIWLMFAPGIISAALYSLFAHVNRPPYADADIYWRPVTAAGARLTRPFGFKLVTAARCPADLHVLTRHRPGARSAAFS